MFFDGHYFIGADNGIFSIIKGVFKADKIVTINIHDQSTIVFPVLDTFIKVAAHLSRSGTLEVIGKTTNQIRELVELRPVINPTGDQVVGSVFMLTIMEM